MKKIEIESAFLEGFLRGEDYCHDDTKHPPAEVAWCMSVSRKALGKPPSDPELTHHVIVRWNDLHALVAYFNEMELKFQVTINDDLKHIMRFDIEGCRRASAFIAGRESVLEDKAQELKRAVQCRYPANFNVTDHVTKEPSNE